MNAQQPKFISQAVLAIIVIFAALPGFAQPGKLELRNLEKLAGRAAEVNDVTLDGPLLQLAAKVMDSSHDPDAAQVRDLIKDLKGIYVKNFEFDEPNQYSQSDVEAIRAQLTAPGWQRIVQSRSKRTGENDEIYLLKQGEKVAGVAILVAEAKELTVVNIVGPVDMEKLGELGGHFGIPAEMKDQPKLKPRPKPEGGKNTAEKKEAGDEKK